ncbi:MAG: hypothetical protein LRY73_03855 [Bacillus sp. (in: Bacteria)]|nr:hypothetical protein [Bacillus sp. (in: firmicutes)]
MKNVFSTSVQSEDGRTLLEVILSLAILSIIIVPFAAFFIQSGKPLMYLSP